MRLLRRRQTVSPPAAATPPDPEPASAAKTATLPQGFHDRLDSTLVEAVTQAAALFPGPLCDRCLGRLVGRLEPRDQGEGKGRALRAHTGTPRPEAEPDCGWCEGFFLEAERFADMAGHALAQVEFDTFLVATRMHPDVLALEANAAATIDAIQESTFEPLKMELNRAIGTILFDRLEARVDLNRPDAIALIDPYFDEVHVNTSALFLYGRYRKLDRTIPQTRWPCRSCKGRGCTKCEGTGQQYRDSVESLTSEIPLAAFEAKDSSFHGAGREDIDALMLGTGRPFILELKEPRWRRPRENGHELELTTLQDQINAHADGRVEIQGLRWSEKKEVARVKNGTPDKAYRAHVVAEAPIHRSDLDAAIDQISGNPVEQRTPNRVAHRRADKVRTRDVKRVTLVSFARHARADEEQTGPTVDPKGEAPEAATEFTLEIDAAAGTYIKELVSSDEGRTQPSFAGLLGVPMKVTALDVVGVGDPFAAENAPIPPQL